MFKTNFSLNVVIRKRFNSYNFKCKILTLKFLDISPEFKLPLILGSQISNVRRTDKQEELPWICTFIWSAHLFFLPNLFISTMQMFIGNPSFLCEFYLDKHSNKSTGM